MKVDESLFRSAYEKYKNKVLSYLERFGIATANTHKIESYIRDFFVDEFDALDCAKTIREEIMLESTKRKYQVELNEKEYSVLKKVLGQLNEDTDDWDEADMPAGMTPAERKAMVAKHNHGRPAFGLTDVRSVYDKISNAKSYNAGVATTRIKPADVIKPMEKDGWKFLKHQPEDEMDRYYFKKTFRLGLAGRKFEYDVNFAPYYEDGLQINWETDYASGNENVDSFDDVPLFFDDEADNDIEYEGGDDDDDEDYDE